MFLFGSSKENTQVVEVKQQLPLLIGSSSRQKKIIEEIHSSFLTEVDNLLASAKISHSLETQHQTLIDKAKRLKSLGFTQSEEVLNAEVEINRLSDLIQENKKKADLLDAINYFSNKYPQHKFITVESVKQICKKYNLVYGNVNKYIGNVPDKNLQQIENFKIHPEDETWLLERIDVYQRAWHNSSYSPTIIPMAYKPPIDYSKSNYSEDLIRAQGITVSLLSSDEVREYKAPLVIVAPVKDFAMNDSEIKEFELRPKAIEIPDPIVLKSVFYNKKQYFLVITAWGLEAEEEDVINQKMN